MSLETAQDGIRVQIYAISTTLWQELRRICGIDADFCSVTVKLCILDFTLVEKRPKPKLFQADKIEIEQ